MGNQGTGTGDIISLSLDVQVGSAGASTARESTWFGASTVMFTGAGITGGTTWVEISLDGTTWVALPDSGTTGHIAAGQTGVMLIEYPWRYIRVNNGGSGGTLSATMGQLKG